MSTPAGWYDAGTPGRLRWWDGAQWTEHECDAPQAAPQVPAFAPAQVAQPQAPASGIAMGWYPVPGTPDTRWWDGRFWTAYSLKNGVPRGNWYAMEPPGIGYTFGALFLGLGLMQMVLSSYSGSARFSGIATMALGVFWLSAAAALTMVRRRPAPVTAQAMLDAVQPLPGQAEGPSAGWMPVTSKVSRWWTGARWSEYVLESDRVRPTFGAIRAYRLTKILAFVFMGLGVLALIAGILIATLRLFDSGSWAGIATIVFGAALVVIGAIILPVLAVRKPALLIPEHPPTQLR